MPRLRTVRPILLFVALPLVYILSGRLGLFLAVPPGYATAIFIPAGVAVSAAFLAGTISLPGVFVGSLALNFWIGYSIAQQWNFAAVVAAFAIATGSTLQAALGGRILRALIGYPAPLDSLRDLTAYLVGIPLLCLTSATFSNVSLWILGIVPLHDLLTNGLTWWAGDTIGVLVTLPLMLVLLATPRDLWGYRAPYVAVPMLISFALFVVIFVHFQSWGVLAAGGLGTGLLGAFLLLGTGHAFRVNRLARELHNKGMELSSVLQATPFMLTRCSRDLRYLFVSEAYARMINRTPEDVVGKSIIEVMGEEGFNTILPFVERVLAGERVEYESKINFTAVGSRLLRVIYTPDRDAQGLVRGWIASIVDISDSELAYKTAQQLSSIVESSNDAIVSKDLNGIILSWNQGAERVFGYSAAEVVGKAIYIVIPPDLHHEEPKILDNIRRGIRIDHYETKRRRKDGRLIDVSLSVSPIKNSSGQIVGASKIARDITEEKRARDRMAADLKSVTRLNQLSGELMRDGVSLEQCLLGILDAAIEIAGAAMGNVQLLDSSSGALTIVAQRGFERPFLTFFRSVRVDDVSACAAAIRSGGRVVVEDVTKSKIFAGQPSQKALLDAGARAVISTPLISSIGAVVGMISVHFAEYHRPDERELTFLDLLARQAADYLDRKRAEDIQKTLVHEVQHRSNNLLGVVQAIIHRSLSGKSGIVEARAALEARLQALARVNRQLATSNWAGMNLEDIVRPELEPFETRISFRGERIELDSQVAQKLSLAVHELATNAAKYGAFSNSHGKVEISWSMLDKGPQKTLAFRWQERDGPPVTPPTAQGFGSTLLKTTFREAHFHYDPDGFSCDINIPIGKLPPASANQNFGTAAQQETA